jgi:hypothetical protein
MLKLKQYLFIGLFLMKLAVCSCQDPFPWKSIFNGQNLDGWEIIGDRGLAFVEDGAITCKMVNKTFKHTFIQTTSKYKDFILEFDCLRDTQFNSGILFRNVKQLDTTAVCIYGYQVKLDPSTTRLWNGGIFEDYGNSWKWLYSLENDSRAQKANKNLEWNHFRIECIGNSQKVWINNIPVTNLISNAYTEAGSIAFKIHYLKNKPEGEKWKGQFKNIKIITDDLDRYKINMDISPLTILK